MARDITSLVKVDGPYSSNTTQKHWDEKGRGILTQIFISYGSDEIGGLQFQYVENGKVVLSPAYGVLGGKRNFTTILFGDVSEYITRPSGTFGNTSVPSFGTFGNTSVPSFSSTLSTETNRKIYGQEYITGLSGTFGNASVTSLSFETNRKTYGPYGGSSDTDSKFSYGFGPLNQFGGFHGAFSTDSFNLTTIGVYVKPTTVFLPSSSSGGFKS